MNLPQRKSLRLPEYDYSTPGAYFITICTHERRCILSQITVGEQLAAPETSLSAIGRMVDEQIRSLPARFPNLTVDHYVVMPNHIHLLLCLSGAAGAAGAASCSPTMVSVIQALKSQSARLGGQRFGIKPLWQRSFHDHVIRSETDYREIWNYIENNPARWIEDRYYSDI